MRDNTRSTWSAIKSYVRARPRLYLPIVLGRRAQRISRELVSDKTVSRTLIQQYLTPDDFILCHWAESTNFGDACSPAVVGAISRKRPLPLDRTWNFRNQRSYSVIGSVLQFPASRRTEVWGSGFIYETGRFIIPPAKIHAVRGPLTRELCLKQGVNCPPVYGDPAVFAFDQFRDLPRRRTYRVGLIPHYADNKHPKIRELAQHDEVKLINVHASLNEIVDACMQCDVIVSSSLHGLILADALEIPSRWLGVSELVMKGGFKFQDYFMSVHRDEKEPLNIDNLTVARALKEASFRVTHFSRQTLLESCPFRDPNISSQADIPAFTF